MVVCRNGFFGHRLADIAQRCGAETHYVDAPWGKPLDVDSLAAELAKHRRVKAVGVVHGETSTGVLNPIEDVVQLAHARDAVAIVDAVTTLGGHDVRMDDWDVDVCFSATQKCLGGPPGLAPITLSSRAVEIINNRKTVVQSFYFSLQDLEEYWSQRRAYHHTAPISMTYALREALRMLTEEGLDNRIERHARTAAVLRAGLDALGIGLLVGPGHRLNPLTTALVPEGVDEAEVRRQLLQDYNIEIGAGLGELRGKAWRIGLMGESARESNVFALLSALEMILSGWATRWLSGPACRLPSGSCPARCLRSALPAAPLPSCKPRPTGRRRGPRGPTCLSRATPSRAASCSPDWRSPPAPLPPRLRAPSCGPRILSARSRWTTAYNPAAPQHTEASSISTSSSPGDRPEYPARGRRDPLHVGQVARVLVGHPPAHRRPGRIEGKGHQKLGHVQGYPAEFQGFSGVFRIAGQQALVLLHGGTAPRRRHHDAVDSGRQEHVDSPAGHSPPVLQVPAMDVQRPAAALSHGDHHVAAVAGKGPHRPPPWNLRAPGA